MKKYLIPAGIVLLFITCKKELKPVDIAPLPPVQPTRTPTLITNPATGLSYFAVVLSGKLTDSGSSKILQAGIVVDTVSKATVKKNYNKFIVQQINSDGSFSFNIGYLPSSVSFFVRAYAINATDTGYGNEIKFTTLSQKIFTGDVNLTTQKEVVDFGAQKYTTIDGGLNISGTVSDLSPLLGLSLINNGFNTSSSQLTNFRGLDSLEITGAIFPNSFWVEHNQRLVNFSGLGKLRISRGSVQIDDNSELVNLDGLENYIAASAGSLRIGENPKLQNINALRRMSFVGQDLYLINNPSLTDISGLSALNTVPGRLNIINNARLQNLNGLEQVTNLPDGLEISDNPFLRDISGLKNLQTINGNIGIGTITLKNNPLLADINSFNQISAVDYLTIQNCGSLKNLSGLGNLSTVTNIMHIENNSLLADMSGLEKLASVGRLEISYNAGIVNLKGLNALKKITAQYYSIFMNNNNKLQSLTGLENLGTAYGSIQISNNAVLTDYCPLKTLFNSGYNDFFSTSFNASNPSQADILAVCR